MTTVQFAVVAGAVFLAAFTQAIAGFGFGLLSVPVMSLAVAPQLAVIISTLVGITITTWQAWMQRAAADRPVVKRMVVGAYVGMPVGLLVLVSVDEDVLRLGLGSAVLAAVVVLALRIDLHHAGPSLDVVAGTVSGVLNTSLSTNGPPLVAALQARRLDPVSFRATIAAVFALSNVGAMALFIAAGRITSEGVTAAAVAVPAMIVGQLLGFPIRRRVGQEAFRWLVLVLLAGSALAAIGVAVA